MNEAFGSTEGRHLTLKSDDYRAIRRGIAAIPGDVSNDAAFPVAIGRRLCFSFTTSSTSQSRMPSKSSNWLMTWHSSFDPTGDRIGRGSAQSTNQFPLAHALFFTRSCATRVSRYSNWSLM